MEETALLLDGVLNMDFVRATISNPRKKDGVQKIKVRPVERKGELCFQTEALTRTQAFHENLGVQEARGRILEYMGQFGQMQIETVQEDVTVLVSKKGKVTIRRKTKKQPLQKADMAHNRKKHYILDEGTPVPFLVDLGVMTKEGRVIRAKFDKFRQINRFLEFIEDILPELDGGREVTILDFGCGKSYLTFAMYYYLHELKKYDIRMIGLDLKKEVIANCSALGQKYGYEKLAFLEGDIAEYNGTDRVDMVVTLHACDTATDFALAKAVGWDAKVILSVPCCQHELNAQIACSELAPVMDYGLLKERFAALVTDGLRAKYLEREGYETQILEFIEMEHTPKNVLIRAVKRHKINKKINDKIKKCEKALGVSPTIGKLLGEDDIGVKDQ